MTKFIYARSASARKEQKEKLKKMQINIWLPGQPATVTHQSGTKISGHRTYKTASLIGWENTLFRALEKFVPDEPLEGPILLQVTFGFKAKRKADLWKWKLTRPDTDNMIKTVKDVMTRMHFWKDDNQVVHEVCKKMYVDEPGIVIKIEKLCGTVNDWRNE